MTKILTTHVYPPIPIRQFDWSAVTDNYDGAPDSGRQVEGSGKTEFYAVLDLYNDWEDQFWPEPLVAHRPGFEEDIDWRIAGLRYTS